MANTTNFGWETPDDTDLVKDGALAMRTLGSAIDTSLVDLKGGTTGQVLSKATNTDLDFTWITQNDADAIQNTIVDAKGDLITATAADTPARLAVGTNGHVLTADSTTSTGLKWAAASSGGKTLLSTTSLSGASTTISNISGDYTDLDIVIYAQNPSANVVPIIKPNNATNARFVVSRSIVGYTGSSTATDLQYSGGGTVTAGRSDMAVFISIKNYASTAIEYKPFMYFGTGQYEASNYLIIDGGGSFYSTTAITSLVFSVPSGTQTGTVLIYGVK